MISHARNERLQTTYIYSNNISTNTTTKLGSGIATFGKQNDSYQVLTLYGRPL